MVATVLLCAGNAVVAQVPIAHNAELPLVDALRLAAERSGTLVAQQAARNAAPEAAGAAGRLPDPVFKAGISNLPVNGTDAGSLTRDFMTMRTIGIAQEFTRDEKRRAREARFERAADVADAGRAVALSNVQRGTAMAWLDRYYRERIVELLVAQRSEARLQVETAEAAFRSGRGAQADVLAARSAAAQIEDRIGQAESQARGARLSLLRWIGSAAERPLGTPPVLTITRLELDHLEPGLQHHPDLALMVRQEDAARAEVAVAQSEKRSDWSFELMYSQRGPAYSNMVSVVVSVPLQWDQKNRQEREVASKLAQVEQMRAQREETAREHLAETQRWVQEWRSDLERLARYDDTLIPLATERSAAALATYRGGGPLSAVLEARRAEIDTRIERVRLEMETAALWAQMEYLIPVDVANVPERRATDGAKQP